MSLPLETIRVNVEYFDGQEEGDVGYPYYVASSDELHFVTDAETLDELVRNIQEVILLHIEAEGEPTIAPDPRILVTVELPFDPESIS